MDIQLLISIIKLWISIIKYGYIHNWIMDNTIMDICNAIIYIHN